jgi:hypothetical protein
VSFRPGNSPKNYFASQTESVSFSLCLGANRITFTSAIYFVSFHLVVQTVSMDFSLEHAYRVSTRLCPDAALSYVLSCPNTADVSASRTKELLCMQKPRIYCSTGLRTTKKFPLHRDGIVEIFHALLRDSYNVALR